MKISDIKGKKKGRDGGIAKKIVKGSTLQYEHSSERKRTGREEQGMTHRGKVEENLDLRSFALDEKARRRELLSTTISK